MKGKHRSSGMKKKITQRINIWVKKEYFFPQKVFKIFMTTEINYIARLEFCVQDKWQLQPKETEYWPRGMVAQSVKNLPAVQEIWVWSLGREDLLEKEMATHSSMHAWKSHGQRRLVGYSPWGRKKSYDWVGNTTLITVSGHSSDFSPAATHWVGCLKKPRAVIEKINNLKFPYTSQLSISKLKILSHVCFSSFWKERDKLFAWLPYCF